MVSTTTIILSLNNDNNEDFMPRISVRDLIVNSLDETGLCSRNQPAPANMVVSALQLLKKRAAQYSNTHLLQFTRKEIDIDLTKHEFIVGEYEVTEDYDGLVIYVSSADALNDMDPASSEYVNKIVCAKDTQQCYSVNAVAYEWIAVGTASERTDVFEMVPDYEVKNLQEITNAYIQPKNGESYDWSELNFIAYEDFYQYGLTNQIYSVLPLTDKCAKVILKKSFALQQFKLKLIYNESFDFDIDTVFNIPKQFVALFSAALVYDLSVAYPRLSENTVAIIKARLDELEQNVRRSSSISKYIGRDYQTLMYTYGDFLAGRFLGM